MRESPPASYLSAGREYDARIERVADTGGFGGAAAYSRAVKHGPFVAVSATAALENGVVLHPGDAYLQTEDALRRSLTALRQLGADIDDVVRTRLLLAPGCDWRAAVRAHKAVFAEAPPANTTFFVGGFIPEGVLVEVELDAVVAEGE